MGSSINAPSEIDNEQRDAKRHPSRINNASKHILRWSEAPYSPETDGAARVRAVRATSNLVAAAGLLATNLAKWPDGSEDVIIAAKWLFFVFALAILIISSLPRGRLRTVANFIFAILMAILPFALGAESPDAFWPIYIALAVRFLLSGCADILEAREWRRIGLATPTP